MEDGILAAPDLICRETSIELIDHTADIGLRIKAVTPAAAFAALTEGMFGIMVKRETITTTHLWRESVQGRDWEDLLVRWLEELLFRYESEGLAVRECHVRSIDPTHVEAELKGCPIDPSVQEMGVQIKAVTYHQLAAHETDDGFVAQVIFDI
jgi:SHS2 domain-containing protein